MSIALVVIIVDTDRDFSVAFLMLGGDEAGHIVCVAFAPPAWSYPLRCIDIE